MTPTRYTTLTPPGAGAIATLAIHGPNAVDILADLFQPTSSLSAQDRLDEMVRSQQTEQFVFGRMGSPDAGMDDVVLTLISVEPAPCFEIHCHGGRQVVALLEECLSTHGAHWVGWTEFQQYIGMDPIQVRAQKALAQAVTSRTAVILLDQYNGALRCAVDAVLIDIRQEQFDDALTRLQSLTTWIPLGRHLTAPWQVAIAGAPNVGKSSLINKLAGYHRCVVSEIPGTTRDMVTTRIAIDGWPVELIDTAGIRNQVEDLEQQGIALARQAAVDADVCLWLVDTSNEPVWPDPPLPNAMVVINKIDLPPQWNVDAITDGIAISAHTGAGLDALCERVARNLVPEVPQAGTAVPFDTVICASIAEAWKFARAEQFDAAVEALTALWQ